jgi:hypothetical protein
MPPDRRRTHRSRPRLLCLAGWVTLLPPRPASPRHVPIGGAMEITYTDRVPTLREHRAG